MTELLYKIKNRRGLAAEWLLADPVLGAGEFGIESDTGKIKIGDGVSLWSVLPYLTDHDHDEAYAAIGHDHDEAYSAIAHDHDEAYSGITHDHEGIGDALSIRGVLVDDTDLADGRILAYDVSGDGSLVYVDPPEGGGAVAPEYWKRPGISFDFPDWLRFSNMGLVEGTTWRFAAAVAHPNGLIYCFPGDLNPDMTKIAIIDPAAESSRLVDIADPAGPGVDMWAAGAKYLAATVGKDGRIYLIPELWAGKILVFDPDTEITTVQAVSVTSGGPVGTSDMGLNSVVCAPDGRLWCIPGVFSGLTACDHFIAINPSDFTATAYPNADGYKFGRSFLAPDGYIYASPKKQSKMARIDPVSNTIVMIDIPISSACGDCVSDQYGRIWIPEQKSTPDRKMVVYDPYDEEYRSKSGIGRAYTIDLPAPWFLDPSIPPNPSSAGSISGGFNRSILGANGLIYCVQDKAVREWGDGAYGLYVLEIDPGSLVKDQAALEATAENRYLFTTHAAFVSSHQNVVRGLLSLPDGRFMSVPHGDGFSRFLIADPTVRILNPDALISAHINKI